MKNKLLLIGLAFVLASCGIPQSPQVASHAAGGVVVQSFSGTGMGATSSFVSPTLANEQAKSQAFWGGVK